MAGVLNGVRVLDLGRMLSAPSCARLLADLGAEVIRVERSAGEWGSRREPGWEERMKELPGRMSYTGDGWGNYDLNRNKKAITLNFEGGEERNVKAREILKELVRHCDVVVENFGPGAAEAMGITYDNYKKVKPDIIFAHSSGFGPIGPYSHRICLDPVVKAMSGIMSITGPPGPPSRDPISYNDFGTGFLTTVGVLAALIHKQKTGQGQMVDTALLRTALVYIGSAIAAWENGGWRQEQAGNRTFGTGTSGPFQAKDGRWVYISLLTDAIWRRFMRFIGREDVANDHRFKKEWDRWLHRDILDPIVAEWVASQTAEEVFAVAEKIPIPCGICYDLSEVAHDPHIKATGMLAEIPLPDGTPVLITSPPIRMSETPLTIQRPLADVGEHNEEIYCGLLGYSREDLVKLNEERII